MNLEGLTEKVTTGRWKTVYYEDNAGEIVCKVCRVCNEVKAMGEYVKDAEKLGGRRSSCKECCAEKDRRYYNQNKEQFKEVRTERNRLYHVKNRKELNAKKRKHYEENKDSKFQSNKNWRNKNKDKTALHSQRYRARKASLPDDLKEDEYKVTLEYFGNACAITGDKDNIEREHAIPLYIGHGGTTFGNIYPMARGLNQSKGTSNLFEWFENNKQRFNLEQWRFDRLVNWLASANAMSVEEYRAYVYECHANPNVIDADEAI